MLWPVTIVTSDFQPRQRLIKREGANEACDVPGAKQRIAMSSRKLNCCRCGLLTGCDETPPRQNWKYNY